MHRIPGTEGRDGGRNGVVDPFPSVDCNGRRKEGRETGMLPASALDPKGTKIDRLANSGAP